MDSARKGMDGVNQKGSKLKSVLTGVGVAAGAAAAGLAAMALQKVAQGIGESITLATDLNEALNKSNVVFGNSAAEIEAFADSASKSLGLSKGAALDAAGSFGNLFDQLGFASSATADMSTEMLTLASDFASFHNADITDVIEAQSAAFRGEYDALQKFVPTINAAAVQQKALEQTGKKSTKMLTEQEKAMAAFTFMTENAGAAQGDFAATSKEGANAQRIAAAEMENAKAQLGEKLLPLQAKYTQLQVKLAQVLMDKVVPAIGEVMKWFEQNQATFEQIGNVLMAVLVPAFETLLAVIVFLAQNQEVLAAIAIGIMAALVPAFIAWATSAIAAAAATFMAAAPLILIGVLVAVLAYLVIKYWDEIAAFTQSTFSFIWDIIKQVFNWIKDNWKLLLAILTGPIGIAVFLIIKYWDQIKAAAMAVFNFIKNYVTLQFRIITGVVRTQINIVLAVIRKVRQVWTTVTNAIKSAIRGAMNTVKSTVFGAVNSVIRKIKQIGNAISNIPGAGAIKSATSYLPSFAAGGIMGASGLALVGERGPELVNLGVGQRVKPRANTTSALQSGAGAGQTSVVIHVHGSIISENDLVRMVRDEFRRGGLAGV